MAKFSFRFFVLLLLSSLLTCSACRTGQSSRSSISPRQTKSHQQDWPALAAEAQKALWTLSPEIASALGEHAYDRQLGLRNPTQLKQMVDHMSSLVQKMYAIPSTSLSPDRALDRRLLSAQLRLAIHEIAVEGRPLHDPCANVESLNQAIATLWLDASRPLEKRLADLAQRLLDVPIFLDNALNNLHDPDPHLCQAAQQQAELLRAFLLRDLSSQAMHATTELRKALQVGISEGARGLESYRKGLTELCTPAAPPMVLGQLAFRQHMALEHGLYWGPNAVRTEASRWLSRANRMLLLSPSDDVTKTNQESEPFSPQTWQDQVNVQVSNLRLLSRQHRLMSISDANLPLLSPVSALHLHKVPELSLWPGVGRPQTPGQALILDGLSVGLAQRGQPLSPPLQARSDLWLALAGETYPGRMSQLQHDHAPLSRLRQTFYSSALNNGWALYAQSLALNFGLVVSDPRAQRFYWQSVRTTAALAIVDVGLHTKNMSYDDALAFLRDKSDLPGVLVTDMATRGQDRKIFLRRAVDDVLRHPTRAAANLLGYSAIEGMRQRLEALRGSSFDLSAFHDALLSHGSIPPAYLSGLIFNDPLPELDPFLPPPTTQP